MTDRPNILLIVSDQEVGRPDIPTEIPLPNHDRLMDGGTTFNNYYVTTTPCTPSRSVMYTGLHTKHTGIVANSDTPPFRELPTDIPTIGHMLRDAGYYTAYKGKWHIGGADVPARISTFMEPTARDQMEKYGFSDYSDEGDCIGFAWDGYRRDGVVASDAAQWIRHSGKYTGGDKPWFLPVNFTNPHDIMFFDATGDRNDFKVDPQAVSKLRPPPEGFPYDDFWDLDLPGNFGDDLSTKPWAQGNNKRIYQYMLGEPDGDDAEAWRAWRSYYFNCIRDVDRHIGTVLDALETSGQRENTVVIYTSDHGEMAGAHGMAQKGPSLYKENARVPFIINHPDQKKSVTSESLVSALDLVPTLLSLAGVGEDEWRGKYPDLAGHDISSALEGGTTPRDETGILFYFGILLLSFDSEKVKEVMKMLVQGPPKEPPPADKPIQPLDDRVLLRGIVTPTHKFARYFRPDSHHVPADWDTLSAHNDLELYDLAADPNEVTNLANDPDTHQETILELNGKLNDLIAAEIGADDGSEMPGDPSWYRLQD